MRARVVWDCPSHRILPLKHYKTSALHLGSYPPCSPWVVQLHQKQMYCIQWRRGEGQEALNGKGDFNESDLLLAQVQGEKRSREAAHVGDRIQHEPSLPLDSPFPQPPCATFQPLLVQFCPLPTLIPPTPCVFGWFTCSVRWPGV